MKTTNDKLMEMNFKALKKDYEIALSKFKKFEAEGDEVELLNAMINMDSIRDTAERMYKLMEAMKESK